MLLHYNNGLDEHMSSGISQNSPVNPSSQRQKISVPLYNKHSALFLQRLTSVGHREIKIGFWLTVVGLVTVCNWQKAPTAYIQKASW